MRRAASFLALTLGLVACDGLVSPNHYGRVVVEAASAAGEPAAGVRLVLYTGVRPVAHGVTDSSGLMRFERVPEGPAYGVYAEAIPEGWAFRERFFGGPSTAHVSGFPVRPDSTSTARFTLLRLKPGTVAALVVDDAGQVVPAVLVTLYTGTGIVSVLPSGADGRVVFESVPAGEYGVSAERPAAYRDTFAEERVYSAPHIMTELGDTLSAVLTFTRVTPPTPE